MSATPSLRRKPATVTLDNPVVPPLQEGTTDPAGESHGRLLHLHRPGHLRPGSFAILTKAEVGVTGEVPADSGIDGVGTLTADQLDPQSHAVGQGRGDDAVEHRPGRQTGALDPELGEPRPPLFELVGLLDALPQLLRGQVEGVAVPVGDHGSPHAYRVRSTVGTLSVAIRSGVGSRPQRQVESWPHSQRPGLVEQAEVGTTGFAVVRCVVRHRRRVGTCRWSSRRTGCSPGGCRWRARRASVPNAPAPAADAGHRLDHGLDHTGWWARRQLIIHALLCPELARRRSPHRAGQAHIGGSALAGHDR